jgi:hypothetical protein
MATTEHTVVLRSKADTSGIEQFNSAVRGFNSSLSGANMLMRWFGAGAISSMAGSAVRSLITAQVDMSNSLARTRFQLRGAGGDFDKNLLAVQEFGGAMQSAGIASNTFAQEISAKSLKAFHNQDKALQVAKTALLGHKIGLLDANSAMNAMVDASNGNTDALRQFLRTLGVSAPEFASFETLLQNLMGAMEGTEGTISEFGNAWTALTGVIAQRSSEIGKYIGDAMVGVVEGLTVLLSDPKQAWQNFLDSWDGFGSDLVKIATGHGNEVQSYWAQLLMALYGTFDKFGRTLRDLWVYVFMGIGSFLVNTVVPFIQNSWLAFIQFLSNGLLAFVDWGNAKWSQFWQWVIGLFVAGGEAIKSAWQAWSSFVIGLLNAFWGTVFAVVASGWELLKSVFMAGASAVSSLWRALWDGLTAIGRAVMESISNSFTAFIDGIKAKIQALVDFAKNTAKSVSDGAKNIGKSVSEKVTGKKAEGGTVNALSTYLVGERGAELFTPSRSGVITPNSALGGTSLNVTVTGNSFMSDDKDVAVRIGNMIIEKLGMVHRFGLSV